MNEPQFLGPVNARDHAPDLHQRPIFPEWRAASFDATPSPAGQSLAEMRRMQDPSRFGKARFSFKLYKR
jgi:hypothetical protein